MTYFSNEVKIGSPGAQSGGNDDTGYTTVSKQVTYTNGGGAGTTNNTFYLPKCEIVDIIFDNEVASNAATSQTASVGTTGTPTLFASSVDLKSAAARLRPTFTAAQMTQMKSVTAGAYTVQLVQVGAGATGNGNVRIIYAPKKP